MPSKSKILDWFISNVLGPALAYILREVLVALTRWLADQLKGLLKKWMDEEESAAPDEVAKEAVREKYRRREADVDRVTREAAEAIDRIVKEAMEQYDEQRGKLLPNPPATPEESH